MKKNPARTILLCFGCSRTAGIGRHLELLKAFDWILGFGCSDDELIVFKYLWRGEHCRKDRRGVYEGRVLCMKCECKEPYIELELLSSEIFPCP
jgi:hypothetical protein